jgi:hypothetical protein
MSDFDRFNFDSVLCGGSWKPWTKGKPSFPHINTTGGPKHSVKS